MYSRLLVPTDGSDGTAKTLEHALELARRYDATIHALSVVDERQFERLEGDRRYETQLTLRENCELATDAVREQCEKQQIPVETTIRDGIPSQVIVEYASENDIDVVVIGTHGRSDHERIAQVGSVTQRVVENATVPVFVVHIGRDTGWG